ncbi:hypothetical protein AAFF_G00428280 [Aldrovandia affinis]|uniref:Uncharacterized protein n=1 Tax=Aldrovandia affinis TaxID=143900 RepID=A0AAD7S9D4_9TELE|nr:hypothetical protein AAFF_G00428280 [Aldrovandia affinis]
MAIPAAVPTEQHYAFLTPVKRVHVDDDICCISLPLRLHRVSDAFLVSAEGRVLIPLSARSDFMKQVHIDDTSSLKPKPVFVLKVEGLENSGTREYEG